MSKALQRLTLTRRGVLAGSAATAALATTGALSSRHPTNWTPVPSFVQHLPQLMQIAGVPGLGIAVAARGNMVWWQSFGVKNIRTSDPVTESTLFEAASMTKPAFAYVAMKLVDQGGISLDRALVSYLRPPYLGDDPALERITVRDVLRHSTGLPNWSDGPLRTVSPPGTSYTYSGEGIVWLQLIVEKLTGSGIGAVMQRMLLGPAGMSRSTMGWDADVGMRAAYGHRKGNDGRPVLVNQPTRDLGNVLLPVALRWRKPIADWTYADQVRGMNEAVPQTKPLPHELLVNAAGGLMTTPTDYLKFMLLMMDGRARQPWEISEASRHSMLTDQRAIAGAELSRGLGWELERHPDFRLFEHSGSNYDIFHSLAVGNARSGDAIVIFTNGANGSALAGRIVREAAGLELFKFLV